MPDWILQLIGPLGMGVGMYAAIRADLSAMKARIDAHEKQIDRLYDREKLQ